VVDYLQNCPGEIAMIPDLHWHGTQAVPSDFLGWYFTASETIPV
jgi:hypothetical protein